MSPLLIQMHDKSNDTWYDVARINPGDRPGSASDNGRIRNMYMFECSPDDNYSTLSRSKGGMDLEDSKMRIIKSEGFEVVKMLRKDEFHDLSIVTAGGKEVDIRFKHIRADKTSIGEERNKV
jgi:hypothetical protein